MKAEIFDLIIKDLQDKKLAYVNHIQKDKPKLTERVIVDLGVSIQENDPRLVEYAFKSVFVEKATDTGCLLYLRPISKESHQPFFQMQLRDSWSQSYQVPRAFLHWPQQPGKTMELVFFADSEFRSGSQISVTSGGVSVTEGVAFIDSSQVLAAGAQATIFAQNSSRTVSTFLNNTGSTVRVGLNPSAVNGWPVEAGAIFEWRNTAELKAYSAAGGTIYKMEETL